MTMPHSAVESIEQEYDWGEVSPSVALIDAIAHYEDTSAPKMAEQLDPPLRRTINLDALNNLITPQKELAISFTYADYHIQIHGNTLKIASPPNPTATPRI